MRPPQPDPFEHIRSYYGVPARRGQRVRLAPSVLGTQREGSITGARGQYLYIRLDGDAKRYPGVFHPTDGVEYLTESAS